MWVQSGDSIYRRGTEGGWGEYWNCGWKWRTLASLRDLHLLVAQLIELVIPHAEDVAHLPICSHSIVDRIMCVLELQLCMLLMSYYWNDEWVDVLCMKKAKMDTHCDVKSWIKVPFCNSSMVCSKIIDPMCVFWHTNLFCCNHSLWLVCRCWYSIIYS